MIRISAFRWVPPLAQGLVRDLRVRWALEEAGLEYEVRLIGREDQTSDEYLRLQPFGQVPAFEEEGLVLFESAAIVLHIAGRSEALLPADPAGRARVTAWMFAAMNSVEPYISNLVSIDLFNAGQEWAKLRHPAADLLMSTVLRFLRHTDLVAQMPALDAYQRRCEARPAFRKALADQMAVFADHQPA
jgi:glutathione S-transferase